MEVDVVGMLVLPGNQMKTVICHSMCRLCREIGSELLPKKFKQHLALYCLHCSLWHRCFQLC